MTVDEFRVLDVNVVGALHGIQTFLRLHEAAGGGIGSIINISSVRGLVGGHGLGAYSTSKFASAASPRSPRSSSELSGSGSTPCAPGRWSPT